MRVIGTAGHVDHGKSTLIAALTGTHPDRLKEEQEREMTIELGFGWLTLPNGEDVGIVDVPGHRDFIENMLAGIGGIDAALLVIAADEGVMPQTREHLAIIDLLQIRAGLIVLTKTDLAPDSAWLDLVETDVRAAVAATVMQDAPLVRVSAKNKTGLDDLLAALIQILQTKPARLDLGRPRLPIDRVFSMAGFGTVVTGTLTDGALSLGDEVLILPSGGKGRVRGLQTHKKKEERAVPGSRTAINISGLAVDEVQRGEVVVHPNQYQSSRRVDTRLRLLKDVSAPLKHGDEVKVFLGTAETIATVRMLGADSLTPGQEGWVQLELRDPLVAVRGDRIILRRPSPSETLGGGAIVDPQPKGRHKRFDESLIKSLESLAQGSPADVLFEAALALGATPIKEMVARSRLESMPAAEALAELIESGKLILLEEGAPTLASDLLVIAAPHWNDIQNKTLGLVESYHKSFPLRKGIPREELKSKLKLQPRIFNAVVASIGNRKHLHRTHTCPPAPLRFGDCSGGQCQGVQVSLIENGTLLCLPSHKVTFDKGQQAKVAELMQKFAANPYSPPSVKECQAEVGDEIVNALIESSELTAVSQEIIFRAADYEAMVAKIKAALQKNGQITLAEVRDLFDTTRKYVQALLEHLDSIGVTVREGDYRKLRK